MKDLNQTMRGLLFELSIGRGLHAPKAYLRPGGKVSVYRRRVLDAEFDAMLVEDAVDAGWVRREKQTGRYIITSAGRAKVR